MANPLPTLQLRYHSKHSEPAVAAPSSINAIIAPCLPELKIGGLGLNLLEIVELGVKLVKDPMGAFSDVLRAFGGDLVSGLLDKLWGPLDDLLKLGWEMLKAAWPAFRDFVGMVRNMFENFLLSIYYRITGKLQNPANPGKGDLRCECESPTTTDKLNLFAYMAIPRGTEISKMIKSLIEELMPEVWTYQEDIPTTSAEGFVDHSTLRKTARYNKRWRRNIDAYDVFDDIAQRWADHPTSHPYARAWKWSNSQLFVEVGFLRMYSFMVEGSTVSAYEAEHEGDGERMHLIIDVVPVCGCRAKLRLHKIVLSQHTTNSAYVWEHFRMNNNRAIVCVGRGGHGLYIGGGPWEPGTKWYQDLSVEIAPSPGECGAHGCASIKLATKLSGNIDERAILYPDVQVYWGLYAVKGTNPSITWFWPIFGGGGVDDDNTKENTDEASADNITLDSSADALKDHLSAGELPFEEIDCQVCGKTTRLGPGLEQRGPTATVGEDQPPGDVKPRQTNEDWIIQQDATKEDCLILDNIGHSGLCILTG